MTWPTLGTWVMSGERKEQHFMLANFYLVNQVLCKHGRQITECEACKASRAEWMAAARERRRDRAERERLEWLTAIERRTPAIVDDETPTEFDLVLPMPGRSVARG